MEKMNFAPVPEDEISRDVLAVAAVSMSVRKVHFFFGHPVPLLYTRSDHGEGTI